MDCREPGCSGVVEDGYCNECGIAPPRPAAVSVPASRATTSSGTGTSHTTGHTAAAARHKLGAGLVEIPQVAEHDPEAAILVDPHIPEEKRFCTNASCGAPVGRGREGLPGRTEGFCSRCGERFS